MKIFVDLEEKDLSPFLSELKGQLLGYEYMVRLSSGKESLNSPYSKFLHDLDLLLSKELEKKDPGELNLIIEGTNNMAKKLGMG